ncbi:hypothetical protein KGH42_004883 [Escherichia coli]|nr:hypothetical protein [Escherichia coli]EHM4467460.1 hypothetical protein [Escherichia coli]EHM4565876.1 hypothetical protein [Escherichia coli]EIM3171183.1 hypothetical protein [Escherichia coli]EJQ8081609.1 hypothetical protein [Escherichia coli]
MNINIIGGHPSISSYINTRNTIIIITRTIGTSVDDYVASVRSQVVVAPNAHPVTASVAASVEGDIALGGIQGIGTVQVYC